MPPAMTGGFSNHLAPGIMAIAGTQARRRNGQRFWPNYWKVMNSRRNFEDVLAAAALPVAPQKPEAQAILAVDPLEGNTQRIFHDEWGIGFEVSQNAWEDDLMANKGSALRAASTGIPDSLIERQEIEGHRPFNTEGFDGTFTVLPDASTLFATSHVPIAGGEAPAQSNRPSPDVALSLSAYRTQMINFRLYVNDRGLRIPEFYTPRWLITTENNRFVAEEIIRSPTNPTQLNPAVINASQNMTGIAITPYITVATHWFIQAQNHFMLWLWRRQPAFDSYDDRRRRIAVFVGFQRFSIFPHHWGGMAGSTGA
jgi:hypothetical protein